MAEKDERIPTAPGDLLRYTRATAIVGDILKIRARDVGLVYRPTHEDARSRRCRGA
jgi:hypothetical protein